MVVGAGVQGFFFYFGVLETISKDFHQTPCMKLLPCNFRTKMHILHENALSLIVILLKSNYLHNIAASDKE